MYSTHWSNTSVYEPECSLQLHSVCALRRDGSASVTDRRIARGRGGLPIKARGRTLVSPSRRSLHAHYYRSPASRLTPLEDRSLQTSRLRLSVSVSPSRPQAAAAPQLTGAWWTRESLTRDVRFLSCTPLDKDRCTGDGISAVSHDTAANWSATRVSEA